MFFFSLFALLINVIQYIYAMHKINTKCQWIIACHRSIVTRSLNERYLTVLLCTRNAPHLIIMSPSAGEDALVVVAVAAAAAAGVDVVEWCYLLIACHHN